MPDLVTPDLTGLTTKLVAAYLRGNPMPISELAHFIHSTHAALAAVLLPKVSAATQQPAVPVKKSVRPDAIICLECGHLQKMLKRHLHNAHALTVDEYKSKWSLPSDYPMTSPDYATTRSDLAKRFGLGRKPRKTRETGSVKPVENNPIGTKYPPSRWSKPSR